MDVRGGGGLQGGGGVRLVEGGGVTLSWGGVAAAVVVVYVFFAAARAAWWQCCRVGDSCRLVGWYVDRLVGWLVGLLVDRLGALGSGRASGRTDSREGFGGAPVAGAPLSFSVSCCQVAGVVLFLFCFHIMLFCSEFTSEEFSSPRTLWFSCLGVRELWMLRESSSLVGAFTGSSSLFWELGSSYPWRGGGGGGGGGGRKYS